MTRHAHTAGRYFVAGILLNLPACKSITIRRERMFWDIHAKLLWDGLSIIRRIMCTTVSCFSENPTFQIVWFSCDLCDSAVHYYSPGIVQRIIFGTDSGIVPKAVSSWPTEAHSTRRDHVHGFVPESHRKSCVYTWFAIGCFDGTREVLKARRWKLGSWNWQIRSHSNRTAPPILPARCRESILFASHDPLHAILRGTRWSNHSCGVVGGPNGSFLSTHVHVCEI